MSTTTTGTPPLSAARTLATAGRVLRQLTHDPRTVALLLLIPVLMITLLRYVFDGSPQTFDSIGASLLGIFPLITMFLVTSIATLRERTSGTLERLLAMPLGKGDLIADMRSPSAPSPSSSPSWPRPSRSGPSAWTSPDHRGCCSWSPCSTPCSARRSACSSPPSRHPSSRPSSSCLP